MDQTTFSFHYILDVILMFDVRYQKKFLIFGIRAWLVICMFNLFG